MNLLWRFYTLRLIWPASNNCVLQNLSNECAFRKIKALHRTLSKINFLNPSFLFLIYARIQSAYFLCHSHFLNRSALRFTLPINLDTVSSFCVALTLQRLYIFALSFSFYLYYVKQGSMRSMLKCCSIFDFNITVK